MINKKLFGIAILSMLVLTMGTVLAFGVAGSNGQFTIAPGETKTTSLRLQNMAGDGDITVQVDLVEGSEIAYIIGNNKFLVKSGTKDTEIPIRINMPSDANIGDSYKITLSIKTITSGDDQGVSFGSAIGQDINVLVVSERTETSWGLTIIILSVIGVLIIGIVIFLIRKKKKKK